MIRLKVLLKLKEKVIQPLSKKILNKLYITEKELIIKFNYAN